MNDLMSVAEAFVYMAKEFRKMCENENTINKEDKMNVDTAISYLNKIKSMTRNNEVSWKQFDEVGDDVERYYLMNDAFSAVLSYNEQEYLHDEFTLYIEDNNGKWYLFDKDYDGSLANIFNWMTVEQVGYTNVIDAEYEVINDNTPFEFVIDKNYNFETLGA